MQTKHLILIALFLTSGIFYYNLTDTTVYIEAQVQTITDGDTLKTTTGQILRLKGINTPEKNQPHYNEATQLLTDLVQNKSIQIESHGTDKYGRTLAHIFLDKKNINEQILKQGLATLYYYEKDKHYKSLKQAEQQARTNQLNLWSPSPNANCLKLTNFQTDEPESLTLQNNCDFQLNITIKDDATHIYQATLNPNSQYTKSTSHIWNTDGDTLYIYDNKGLILFQRY